MKYFFITALASVFILSSCRSIHKIASVTAGDHVDKSKVKVQYNNVQGLSDYETFAYYKAGTTSIIEPSNLIEFQVIKKVKTKKSKNGGCGFGGCFGGCFGGGSYAYVNVHKYFYKYRKGAAVFRWILMPFTFGMSVVSMNPHQKTLVNTVKCKETDDCKNMSYSRKILIETDILCKGKSISDTVKIIENLPEEMKITDKTIKIKKGKKRVASVIYNEKIIDGQAVQFINIVGVNGSFKKANRVWVILDVLITPGKKNSPVTSNENKIQHKQQEENKTQNETATVNNSTKKEEAEKISKDTLKLIKPEIEKQNPIEKTEIQNEVLPEKEKIYFIVAGSYPSVTEAEKQVAILKSKGFDGAEVMGKNEAGSYRVCYKSFSDKNEALKHLQEVKSKTNSNAWLYEKK